MKPKLRLLSPYDGPYEAQTDPLPTTALPGMEWLGSGARTYPTISAWHVLIDGEPMLEIQSISQHRINIFLPHKCQPRPYPRYQYHSPDPDGLDHRRDNGLHRRRSDRSPRPGLCHPCIPEEGHTPYLRVCEVSGEGEEPSDRVPSLRWKVHLLREELAANRLQRHWVRADRVDCTVEHSGDRREELDGALLREHRGRACPLPHRPCPHFAFLAVANHVALGAVPLSHFRPDWVQGQDRGVLLIFSLYIV